MISKARWTVCRLRSSCCSSSPASPAAVAPRAAYIRTLLGALEMLRGGVTCVLDDAFFVPSPSCGSRCGHAGLLRLRHPARRWRWINPMCRKSSKLPFLRDLLPPHLLARASQPAPMIPAGLLSCYQH